MPQWPGTNENFALIIGMYFKILSVPNYGKRVFYVHLAYRWCCYRLGMPGASPELALFVVSSPIDSSLSKASAVAALGLVILIMIVRHASATTIKEL